MKFNNHSDKIFISLNWQLDRKAKYSGQKTDAVQKLSKIQYWIKKRKN